MSRRLERRVREDFATGAADAVLERLGSLRLALADEQSLERIQAAVVVSADGNIHRFEQAAHLAEVDWRDALIGGGLAHADWPALLDAELGTSTREPVRSTISPPGRKRRLP